MPNVMAAQPNIEFCNYIPCKLPQSFADAAAGVPCSNTANIGEY